MPTSEILVVSRYLLHLAGPTILLAAAATPLLMKLRIWVKIPFGIYLFTVPLLHGHFIGAVDFNQQQEKTFLLESRGVISEGCTVLEYSSPSNNRFGGWFDGFGSRILRAGSRVRDGRIERAWRVGIFQSVEPDAPLSMERILDELELSEDDCLLYYRGFECYIRGSASPPMARPCIALERSFTLEPLVTTRFPARVYDVVFSGYEALEDRSGRFQDSFNNSGRPIELGFFRVTGRR